MTNAQIKKKIRCYKKKLKEVRQKMDSDNLNSQEYVELDRKISNYTYKIRALRQRSSNYAEDKMKTYKLPNHELH